MSHKDELQAELARMRSEMLALLAVNQTMRASRDLASLYRAVAAQLAGVVRCDSLFIALYMPEIDRAAWFTLAEARRKIVAGQGALLDELSARYERR